MILFHTKSPTHGRERKPSRSWFFGLKFGKGHLMYYSKLCAILNWGFTVWFYMYRKNQKWTSFVSEFPVDVYLREKNPPKQIINSNPLITFLKWIEFALLGVQLQCKDKQECIGCQSKANWLKLGLWGARPQINERKDTEFSFFNFFLTYSSQKKSLGASIRDFTFQCFSSTRWFR